MDILINPATSLVQKLVEGAIQESRYLCCFNPIVEDFEKEKENLIATEKRVQKDVHDAKNNDEEIEEEVKKWLQDAKSLIEEDTKAKQKCFFNLCPNCIWRYWRGKELAQKKADITKLIEKSDLKVGRPVENPGIKFHSSPDYIDFESRKSAKKQLLDALEDRSSYLIGLQGMGGCGKSQLVKEVGNQVQNSEPKLFDRVIYVVVSSSPDVKKIQHDIASHLGLTLEEKKESEHAEKLWSRLTNGEKILIILDDVWEVLNLKDIGIPLGKDHKGCCVLITTRNKGVCNLMDCKSLIELNPLSKEDAWTLFRKRAGLSDDFSNDFQNVGRKIAEECQSLPVVVAAVASTLKGRPLELWNSAFTSLKYAEPIENTEGLIKAYRSLELSYNYLKSEQAKRLFLLCSLFPEDYEIPIEDLTRFGIGLGLFGEVDHSYEILRAKVISALDELLDSCLLLQASKRCVSMHDLIRDVAQWIANKKIQLIIGPKKNAVKHSTIRYVYCDKVDDFPNWLSSCIELEFLIVNTDNRFGSVEILEACFERMKGLKVLELAEHISSSPLFSAPGDLQSIKLLQNLRTLRLKGCNLDDITFLEKLKKLETLELSCCLVNELPNGIVKLEKLRLLGLTKCQLRKNPWKVICGLSKIEELYFMGNEMKNISEWGIDGDFIARLFNKNSIEPALQRYQIDMTKSFGRNLLFPEDDLRSTILCIDHFRGFASHATIIDLVRRAQILHLNKIQGYRSVTPDVVEAIGDMNELIQLRLYSCSEIEYLIDTTSTGSSQAGTIFNKLVKLDLENMEELVEVCHDSPPSDLFKELKELRISRCRKLEGRLFARNLNLTSLEVLLLNDCCILKSLFTPSTARNLVQLKRLGIFSCIKLKHIITNEQEEEKGEEIVHDDHQQQIYGSFFPNLNSLQIVCGAQLEFIFPVSSVPDLPSLESIRIESSPQLKYIFGPYPNKDQLLHQKGKEVMLPACKKLALTDLPNFISIFPESCHPTLSSSYLEDGPKARQLEITTSSGLQTPNSEWLGPLKRSLTFRNIREMEISNCQKLMSLFTLPIGTMLLEVLTIKKCDALRHIIENGGDYHDHIKHGSVFPKLRWLIVQDCSLLEFIFPAAFSGDLASLEWIKITNASKLKYVFGQHHDEIDLPSQNQNLERKIHIPKLKSFKLANLPKIISICVANCYASWPSLKSFNLWQCPLLTITCISESIVGSDTTQLGRTTKKIALRETMKHLGTLEYLCVVNTKIEGILNVNGLAMDGQEVTPKLRNLKLFNLLELRYIFMGPKHIFSLRNVEVLVIQGCEKLEGIFSASVLKSLPQLCFLHVEDCKELKQIVEENEENQNGSKPHNQQVCFPQLAAVVVKHCGNLKRLFSISTHCEFPKLQLLLIEEASKLEQVFAGERGRTSKRVQVVLPELKYLILKKLPSLASNVSLGIQLQPVEYCIVHDCPELSLSSPTSLRQLKNHFLYEDIEIGELQGEDLAELIGETVQSDEDYETEWTQNDNSSSEDVESQVEEMVQSDEDSEDDYLTLDDVQTQVEETLESEMPSLEPQSSKGNVRVDPMLEEAKLRIQDSRKGIVQKCPTSEKPTMATSSTESELRSPATKPLAIPLQKTTLHSVDETHKPTVLESPISDLEPKESSPGSLVISTEEAFPLTAIEINKEGLTSKNSEIITSINNSDPGSLPKSVTEIVEEGTALEKFEIVTCLTNSELGSTSQSVNGSVEEGPTSEKAMLKTSSTNSESSSTSLHETSPHSIIKEMAEEILLKCPASAKPAMATSTTTDPELRRPYPSTLLGEISVSQMKDREVDPVSPEDVKEDDLLRLIQLIEESTVNVKVAIPSISVTTDAQPSFEDNLVAKAFADLEATMKMALKDIASSDAHRLRLENTLNFLSHCSSADGVLLTRFKATINSLRQNLPTILSSFRQASATIDKFNMLEKSAKSFKEELPRRKEAAISLKSKISDTAKSIVEAQQKESSLMEQIYRLQVELESTEKEIKDREVNLSSFQEQKEEFVADTMVLMNEFKAVMETQSQTLEDQRNAQQELFKVNYEWSALCRQFEQDCTAASNLS